MKCSDLPDAAAYTIGGVRVRGGILTAAVVALAVGVVPAAAVLGAGLPAWDTVPAASPNTTASLREVADLGGTNVWAVGNARPNPLIERWNGSAFVGVPVTGVAGRDNVLEGVDGVAANDLWAVGHADRTDFVGSSSLTYRWNGTRWTRVPSPNLGNSEASNNLLAVAAVSSRDVWAVGQYVDFSTFRAITLRWNGTAWRAIPNACGTGLVGVTALAANDVWAVGGGTICHWDGTRWTAQRAPTIPGRSVNLQDIDGAAGALWAVGIETGSCGEGVCGGGVILRRSGTGWVRESSGYALYGITVVTASDVWAVGRWAYGPLLLHRNSSGWQPAATPDTPGIGRLWGVAASSPTSLWAVGDQLTSGTVKTLALRAPSKRSGAVVGDTGVGHASVSWFGPESGTVDADQFGQFQAGGLNAGSYTFTASQQGCKPARRQITVVAGATATISLRPLC